MNSPPTIPYERVGAPPEKPPGNLLYEFTCALGYIFLASVIYGFIFSIKIYRSTPAGNSDLSVIAIINILGGFVGAILLVWTLLARFGFRSEHTASGPLTLVLAGLVLLLIQTAFFI